MNKSQPVPGLAEHDDSPSVITTARPSTLPSPEGNSSQEDGSPTDLAAETLVATDVMDTSGTSWQGWAELENDPLIFTSILHDLGVRGVEVSEVIPLESIFDKDPSSILGLIFLSRWAAQETVNEATHCPDGLWFANQISTFSCASVALMNIINNHSEIKLGKDLNSFKLSTAALSPKQRGVELDGFQPVKDVHNAFSRLLDRMQVDLRIKDEAQAAARRRRRPRKALTKRRKKIFSGDDEYGFHFVAYVPAQGHLWRMDGMESYPRDMGIIEDDSNWLMQLVADIQTLFDSADADGTEFSLLSVNHERDSGPSQADQSKATRLKEDWGPFIAHMLKLHAEKDDLDMLMD